MTHWLSKPVERLLQDEHYPYTKPGNRHTHQIETDVLIVGSGYGAAMAALALLEPDQDGQQLSERIWIFERGKEYVPGDFPGNLSDLPGEVGSGSINSRGLWDVRLGDNVVTVSGRGLGGTSLVNANVAARPSAAVLDKWPGANTLESGRWHTELMSVVPRIEKLLGVSRHPDIANNVSFQSLGRSASAMGGKAEPAPLTINFDGPTPHSARHAPCNNCGNCVTGCHSGAKGSLNMNAWPLARQLGAELFTGVVVSHLSREEGGRWLVHCQVAGQPEQRFMVNCKTVILGAGTLGSTEILMRSREEAGLSLSPMLGQRFSTNGDALVFGIGQKQQASKQAPFPGPDIIATDAVGPTISGMASINIDDRAPPVTVEDAVIPNALRDVWQEMIASQALLRHFGDGKLSHWHQANPEHDLLARSDELARHSQTLLIMGHDEGQGCLQWEDDGIRPSWPAEDSDDSYYAVLDRALRQHEAVAFDAGLYSPNILSQPLPPAFQNVVEGADALSGLALSVHPLGGCAMGGKPEEGVVNPDGQVFSLEEGGDESVWSGLYVTDGAILPGPVGTNPFLTIASLSFCLGRKIRQQLSGKKAVFASHFPVLEEAFREIPPGEPRRLRSATDKRVEARFNERLVMHLDDSKRSFLPWSRRGKNPSLQRLISLTGLDTIDADTKSLVLDVSFFFAQDNSLDQWLQHPASPLNARATLSCDTKGSILTTEDRHLVPLATLTGEVCIGIPRSQGMIKKTLGIISALLRYLRYRGLDLLCRIPAGPARFILPEKAWQVRFGKESGQKQKHNRGIWAEIKSFIRIAALQAEPRLLSYRFESEQGLKIQGEKTLCYRLAADDLLRALMVLPVTIRQGRQCDTAVLELDGQRISQGPAPLQITRSPDLPTSVMAAAGFGMYALRLVMKTHFWSFAAPDYAQYAKRKAIETTEKQGRYYEPPDMIFYGDNGEHHSLPKEKYENAEMVNGKPIPVARLVRYQPSHGGVESRRSILLIHGLAHSSRVFWTDTITCNFTQYFLNKNYDVWILDHRVSANYVRHIDPEHTWEQIAHRDVPWAVKTAFNQANRLSLPGQEKGIHVFAHCIGAGAISMSALKGDLDYDYRTPEGQLSQRSMLASLVPHAVTPWLTASAENRVRANAWALIKELEPIKVIEPLPYRDPKPLELIYDRLAALAVNRDESKQWRWLYGFRDWRGPGFARSIYTRYTIFWGRQWWNENISRKTRREFAGMIGPVPIGVMQQVYFSMTRGLLSSKSGNNDFVKADNFAAHWTFPTMFLHGNRNTVFDMASSRHSADQLTRLRIKERTGVLPVGPLSPNQYAEENIWIEVLNDYGHMDMIFSKSGHLDVFPRLHRFFEAVERKSVTETYSRADVSHADLQRFWSSAGSQQRQKPVTRPKAGPVISRPQWHESGQLELTVWAEEQGFCALEATALTTDHELVKDMVTPLPSTAYSEREFWLGRVVFPESDRQISWAFDYPVDDHKFPDEKDSVSVNLADLDWVSRGLEKQQQKHSEKNQTDLADRADEEDRLRLLLGSCFYPGTPLDRELAQQVFSGMFRHVSPAVDDTWAGVDAIVLLGDQIYADATADLFDPKTHYERYRNPYQLALANPAARRLFSHVPSYFAVDDHEYRDNWRGIHQGDQAEFHYARQMAALFQRHVRSQSPEPEMAKLWYDFESMGYPFFVIDSRFQRVTQPETEREMRLLDDEQWHALQQWFSAQAGEPVIFLVSGSPIAPVSRSVSQYPELAVNEDSLLAYPAFLSSLAKLISESKVAGHLVWLCGDPHLSCTARLSLTTTDGSMVKITQICSSGLYAPLPFANANPAAYDWHEPFDFMLTHHGQENAVRVAGEQRLMSDAAQHFTRLTLRHQLSHFVLELSCYDGYGDAITDKIELALD
ncbi:MAG: alkaline phosphatase D family protein [Pseudohongiella nitratireducens]|nr:alkaline phosphatase D family protein [Pseudohongiella nitratireducens]